MITAKTVKNTRNGAQMAFLTLEDRYAEIEVIVFPKQLEAFGSVLLTDTAVRIKGTLADREDEGVKILLSEAQLLSTNADLQAPKTKSTDASFPPASSARLYLRVPSLDDPLTKEALEILNFAKGEVTVLLYDQKTGKTVSPKNTRTTASELLLGALRALLGEANVVYRP
jgi:DNA polymerase-3 subunit alpha